jgi:hypothetical protein
MVNEASAPRSRTNVTISGQAARRQQGSDAPDGAAEVKEAADAARLAGPERVSPHVLLLAFD